MNQTPVSGLSTITKPNGDPYYKYMLCYVENLLSSDFQLKEDMDAINFIYPLKEGFVPHYPYLGSNFEKVKLEYVHTFWYSKCVD